MDAPRIRALALCIFHRNGRILVHEFQDAVKQTAQSPLVPEGLYELLKNTVLLD